MMIPICYSISFVENGYNMVNVSYALVPDYKFPVPVLQMNQAINFLVNSSVKYNLNIENVVMGSSAGSILTSQYGTIISNQEYANSLDIEPLLTTDDVKALVIEDALLAPNNLTFSEEILFGNYLGANILKVSEAVKQFNTLLHLNDNFPPSSITAANTDGFPEDMKTLSNELTSYQTDNDYFYLDKTHGEIAHGYLANIKTDRNAQKSFRRLVQFFDKYTKGSTAE